VSMRFFFADCHDYVDPGFDFEREEHSDGRRVQHSDLYAHEMFDEPPYDGILVSKAIVGGTDRHGKYSTAQLMRLLREGAAKFLRYEVEHSSIMGDCGAFSYRNEDEPPFSVEEVVHYYVACGFTHGVSIDHVILGYDESLDDGLFSTYDATDEEWKRRYYLTLAKAKEFLEFCHREKAPFVPMGVAQGWSPNSYRDAVKRLVEIGYDYVAVGGLVPLKERQILRVLEAIREAEPEVKLHLFGFSKLGRDDPEEVKKFLSYRIESFDSTSPMLRSFRDGRCNYLVGSRWYTALRIPHADESRRFKGSVLAGLQEQQELRKLEAAALKSVRDYAVGAPSGELETALEALEAYNLAFAACHKSPESAKKETLARMPWYRETLAHRPWEQCRCRVCQELGVEVVIFRGNNRNRRRGFHNLQEFYGRLCALRERTKETAHAGV
jgi:hypothetical protein